MYCKESRAGFSDNGVGAESIKTLSVCIDAFNWDNFSKKETKGV